MGILTLLPAIALPVTAAAAVPDDLVSYRPGPVEASPEAVVAVEIVVRDELLAGGAPELRIEFPDGPVALAVNDGFESRGPGDVTWRGRLRYEPDSRVVLTLRGGFVAGRLVTPFGLYQIRALAGDRQSFERLDPTLFPECEGGVEPPATPPGFVATAGDDPADEIEVMALYTPQAESGAGGQAQIEATIQAALDNANTSFIDSDMIGRLVLVHTEQAARNDSGSLLADLEWLASDAGVAALRNTHSADMVSLLVNSGSGCGIAYVMRSPGPSFAPNAFQVTRRSCAVGNLTWAHEHGHNLGFEHDPANGASSGTASYPWSFGHFVSGVYRTVMSYSNQCIGGCTRVAHFSNPDIDHAGSPTGIAGQRDNARTGDLTAPIAANFRSSPTQQLTVTKEGAGSGSVTSSPGGISCGATCSADFATDTVVMLAAAPAADSSFAGWSGDPDCADGEVTMSEDRACVATFDLLPTETLTVTKAGSGDGTVTSAPGGIDCGVDCDESYIVGTMVHLSGSPDPGSELTSWSGDADCTDGVVTLSVARACTATFNTCSTSSSATVENTTVSAPRVESACNTLHVGPDVEVDADGTLELHAGNEVYLYDGVEVLLGGELYVFVGQPLP